MLQRRKAMPRPKSTTPTKTNRVVYRASDDELAQLLRLADVCGNRAVALRRGLALLESELQVKKPQQRNATGA